MGAASGDLSWCNQRTLRSLHDRGWIVYLGDGSEHFRANYSQRLYRLTTSGEQALARFRSGVSR